MRMDRKNKLHISNWKRRTSLVLVLTMLFSILMNPGWYKPQFVEAAPTANGRIVYSINTTAPQHRAYTVSSNTFGAQTTMPTGAAQAFMVDRAAPTRNEHMAGYVTTAGVLYIFKWDGTSWIEVTNTAAPTGWGIGSRPTVGGNGVNGRRFDIAYENTSGNAMVVYSTNVTTSGGTKLAYRTWNGTTSTWSAATNITTARSNQVAAMTWVKLKANPTAGSNMIAVTAQDTGTATGNNSILTSLIWNGTSWGNEPATAHATNMTSTITTPAVQNDAFDMAFESVTGDLVLVWTTSAANQYRTFAVGTSTWGTVTAMQGTYRALPGQMTVAADPQSDQIMAIYNSGTAVYGNIWNGTAWGTQATLTNFANNEQTAAINKRSVTGEWLVAGGTSYGVALWGHATAGSIGYNYWNGTAWGTAANWAAGTGAAANWIDTDVDQYGQDTLMLTISTGAAGTGSLWAKRLVLSAGPTFTWTNADGSTAESTALASATSQNFGFAYDRRPVTLLGTGVDATTTTVCPGSSQKLGGFSFKTTSGTDSVTALTVTTTGQAGIASLQIWDEAGTTQYFSTLNNAASDTWNFSGGTAIPVTTTQANFKIVVIYDSQATAPAGNTATTGYVSAFTSSLPTGGADTAEATVTLNNTASTAAAWGANTGGTLITLNWTNGSGGNALIVRFSASTDTTVPTEGTSYTPGAAFGGGTVVYDGSGTTTTDNPAPGTYYYRIYAHDTCGNYATLANSPWTAALTKTNTTTLGTGVDAGPATVCPGSTQKLGGFSFKTGTGTDSVTALTVTTTGQLGITSLQIWNEAGTTQYFTTLNNTNSDTWNFNTGTAIPVTTTQANYKIVAIYDPQATAPAGNTTTTGYVSAYTCTLAKIGSDSAEATITLDNTASSAAVWGSNTGGSYINLYWTNGNGGNVMIARYTASTDTTMPAEGTTTYTVGSAFGTGGTVAYFGNGTSWKDGPTSTGTYYYRAFAYDSCGNYATTAPWSAGLVKAKFPSTNSSCADCHNYGSSFADAASRNNPPGEFVGSHNTHVVEYGYVCSKCHVAPATETSSDFGHRNANIQITTNINGDTGGAYGKGTSWTQTSSPTTMKDCTNVYCHSQGTGKTTQSGDTRNMSAPTTTLAWGQTDVCSSCHGYPPSYANGDTTWGAAKANSHSKHQTQCSTCHNATTTTSSSITGTLHHADRNYDIVSGNGTTIGSYTYAVGGGTCSNIYCHFDGTAIDASRQWGTTLPTATYQCITCHKSQMAITVGPLAGTGHRDAVVNEFGLAWGHKKTGRGAVTDADCIVCHLEGKWNSGVGSSVVRTTFHGDGYIDLRAPDGTGEQGITYVSAPTTTFRFAKFSTSYAAGSRTSTGQNSDNIDNVLTQKFCIVCHDSNGATNTTARTTTTSTAAMPFGGIALGANYTAANGAIGTQGLVDVKTQFAYTTYSAHPVLGPLNRDFPTAARVNDPYKPTGSRGTSGTLSNSVVLNCFDCHNAPTTPLTDRTIVAHGNANTLRGTIYTTAAAPTLCVICHIGVYTGTGSDDSNHGAGSAGATISNNQGMFMNTECQQCHGSANTYPARPIAAQDYHGNSYQVGGTGTWASMNGGAYAAGGRMYAFIRNTTNFIGHRPYKANTQWTTGSAWCQGDGTHCAANNGSQGYTPGGTY